MQTTVNGAGTLSFYWKVSSEEDFDYLEFYIDGLLQDRITGLVHWKPWTNTLPLGSHTLEWRYTKDGSVNFRSDCGWVDKVEWITTDSLSEALDTTLSSSWGLRELVSAQSWDILYSEESWMRTTVRGK